MGCCDQKYYYNSDCGCEDTCKDDCNPCSEKCKSTKNRTSDQVFYKGPELLCIDVENCESLTSIIQKLDAKVCELQNLLNTTTTSTTQAPTTTSTTTANPSSTTTTTQAPATTTTTTTIEEQCIAYILEATANNASWVGEDCEGTPVGGVIALAGNTTNTGCILNTSLQLSDAVIIYSEVCNITTTTTTTSAPLDCSLEGEGEILDSPELDCDLEGEGEVLPVF